MTYDRELGDRLRATLQGEPGVSERQMFGGLAFLVDGNMAVAASGQGGLLLRIDPAEADSLVDGQHARRFEMRGRAMDGWLQVDVDLLATDEQLAGWVRHGVTYARSLPPR